MIKTISNLIYVLNIDVQYNDYNDYVLVNRTYRYKNININYKFLSKYRNIIFVGLENEYKEFVKDVPCDFITCKDFLEMAQIIAGCKFFIGNQSSPLAIAQALDVPRLGELSNGDSVHYVGEEEFFPRMNWISDTDPNWHLGGSLNRIKIRFK